MRIPAFGRGVLYHCAAFALLAGCGGSQSQLAPSGPFQKQSGDTRVGGTAQTGMATRHPDRGRSWMEPGVSSEELLYITNLYDDNVFVFSYPQAKLVGKLTGFNRPGGMCTDKRGDVFIVNNSATVVEYEHGGTSPIATLSDPVNDASNCSVDPKTGNLAVANITTYSSGSGDIAIFAHAKGAPTYYYDKAIPSMYFCGYDDKGNLFVDGFGPASSTGVAEFAFGELPRGKKTFKNITLKGPKSVFPGKVYWPGKIFWDGKYLAVGDQKYGSGYPQATGIYRTTGAGGKVVSVTPLTGSSDIVDLWIDGDTVIAPDFQGIGQNNVFFYKYPAGGNASSKTITNEGFNGTYGAALSAAK
jgi:hypothetical protein